MLRALIEGYGDIIVATVLFTCSGFVSYRAYDTIARTETRADSIITTLHEGRNPFSIVQGQHCIGELSVYLTEDGGFNTLTKGTLRATYQGKPSNIELVIEARFNPLGQLFESRSSITAHTLRGMLTTKNSNPITMHIETAIDQHSYSHELPIPGPLWLKKNTDGTFRIEYQYLHSILSTPVQGILQASLKKSALSFKPEDSSTSFCNGEPQADLDITPLLATTTLVHYHD